MIIESVAINNFRSYKGEHLIELDIDNNRPVTLVYGKNGAGKTGFLNAILWCLFGSVFFGSSRSFAVQHMNKIAKKQKKFGMSVRVAFRHEGQKWIVERSFEYSGSGSKESALNYKGDVGGPIVSIEGDLQEDGFAAIESVLPMNAAHFHFFDGEQMRRYTREKNPDEVRRAIELVLNLPTLINSKSDLRKTIREIEDERGGIAAKNDKYSNFLERREEIDQGLEDVTSKIEQHTTELDKVSEELSIIEERLSQYDDFKEKIDDLRDLRIKKESFNEQLASARKEFENAKDLIPYAILEAHLRNAVTCFRSKREEIEKRVLGSAITEEKIRILSEMKNQNDVCQFCGTVLTSVQKEYVSKQINLAKQMVDPGGETTKISSELLMMAERSSDLLSTAASASTEITGMQTRIAELNNQIRAVQKNFAQTEKDLGGIDEDLYIADRSNREKLMPIVEKESSTIEDLRRQKDDLETSREETELELDKHSVDDDEMSEILEEKTRATRAFDAISKLIDDYILKMRSEVEEKSSEIFRALTHKRKTYDCVCVGEDFAVDVIDKDGDIVSRSDLSAGEQQVLALSFMGGLARASNSGGPFMMDTPFGRLDKEHKINILGVLPELSDQVVLFVTNDDLDQYEESILNRRISKIYEVKYDEKKRSSGFSLRS
jgi:DNA sulfur modification protein DndD